MAIIILQVINTSVSEPNLFVNMVIRSINFTISGVITIAFIMEQCYKH